MEEILKKFNYKQVEKNTWIKGDWTVRFDDELIEVFNDPDKSAGEYFSSPITKIDLNEILHEVDKKCMYIIEELNKLIIEANTLSEWATGNTYLMLTPHTGYIHDWLMLWGQQENGSYSITGNDIFFVKSDINKLIDITKLI